MKIITKVAIVVVVILGAVLLINSRNTEKITIGISAPETGFPEYGEAIRNGIKMAINESDQAAKNKFSFVFEDNGYSAQQSISSFRKLNDINKAKVVYMWGSSPSDATAPLVEESDSVMFAASIDPTLTTLSDYFIRLQYSPEELASSMWNYFRANDIKNIGIIQVNIVYFEKYIEALQKLAHRDESVIVIEKIAGFDTSDFRTQIIKIRDNIYNIDALGVFLAGDQIVNFYKQSKQLGLDIPMFGSDAMESTDIINKSGDNIYGTVYPYFDVVDDFKNRYTEIYGSDTQITTAAVAYDFAKYIMENNIDFVDRKSILESISKIKTYDGVSGEYNYIDTASDRQLSPKVMVRKITKDGIMTIR